MKSPSPAPGYAAMYPLLCEVARAHGYALAVHGTLQRDMDLVAIPWTEDAATPEVLVAAMRKRGQWFEFDADVYPPSNKPHGRRAWTIPLMGEQFIDLSVMPLNP